MIFEDCVNYCGNPFNTTFKSQMRYIFYTIIILAFLSCHLANHNSTSLRDSVIQKYFLMVDSSGRFDTSDIDYKALRAYVYNDTTALKNLGSIINQHLHNRPNWELWKTDIPLPELSRLGADEAYRFIFSVYDAPAYEAITISKKDTSVKLNYLFYKHDRDNNRFEKLGEFEKNLTTKQWNEMKDKIENADFWYLENEREGRGRDGNDLTVIGYWKTDYYERTHYVHRFVGSPLDNLFYYVYYYLLNKNERQFGNE